MRRWSFAAPLLLAAGCQLLGGVTELEFRDGASCSDGCSSCGGCGTTEAKPAVESLPLAFRPRAKR